MKLLRVIASIDPAVGGPVEGARRIDTVLAAQGHTVEVVCLDAPSGHGVVDYPAIVHALGPVGKGYGYSAALVPWLKTHHARFDAVVVNGIWQYPSFAAWRALAGTSTPYFVFTHGMLDPWFKRTYPLKHLKKWLYWPWAEYRVLRDAAAVIFTCEEERRLARESFWLYRCNEAVSSYGTAPPPGDSQALRQQFFAAHPALAGKRIVLFLSRIHEKKGIDLLVDAFANVADRDPHLHLVIAGPDQTGWQARLQTQAKARGVGDRISWPGMLKGEAKWGAYHASEVFCLPSHQENFGIVVAEAMACGKPVLISDKVNIWREIDADGAGFIANDDLKGTQSLLTGWLELDEPARSRMSQAARACFEKRFRIERVAGDLLRIFQSGRASGGAHTIQGDQHGST